MRESDIIGPLHDVVAIASGRGVRIRRHLDRAHGPGRWRKMKGIAAVRLADGRIREAEIHWFEAAGIGRRDFKVKRVIP